MRKQETMAIWGISARTSWGTSFGSMRGTYQMETGCGPMYVTINEDDDGMQLSSILISIRESKDFVGRWQQFSKPAARMFSEMIPFR